MNSNIDTFKCTHNYILYAFAAQITEDFKVLGTLMTINVNEKFG